jgi:septation ring formation regulator EzrA
MINMGERIGNWGANCNTITVLNYTTWYVEYDWSRKNIVECNNALTKISNEVNKFVGDITTLKNYMKNSDFDHKNAEFTDALTTSVGNVKTNFGKLTDMLVTRLDNAAKTDSWFGQRAANSANYIRQYIK